MGEFSTLMAPCEENPSVTSGSPSQKANIFDVPLMFV